MGIGKWLPRIPLLIFPGLFTLPKSASPVKKIVVLLPSSDEASSIFAKYGDHPDPSRYIASSRHEITVRRINLANAKAEIDAIIKEGHHYYLNYLSNDGAGVAATKHLESKGAVLLTNPSSFLTKNTLNALRKVTDTAFEVPSDTPGKYPKVVRFEDGSGSFDLTEDSICHTEEEVTSKIASLKQKNATATIITRDHIVGKSCSAIVIGMGRQAFALDPLEHTFLQGSHSYVVGEQRKSLQTAAEKAFKAVGGSGYARVDLIVEEATNKIHVVEVVGTPLIFFPVDNKLGDDTVISDKYPGGHASLMDMLIATKRILLNTNQEQDTTTAGFFDKLAPQYDKVLEQITFGKIHAFFAQNHDFTGTVLDVACGSGAFGKALDDQGQKVEISGLELSPGMAGSPFAKKFYKQPVRVGPMQELIMNEGEYDHVVCLGSLHLIDAIDGNAVLARMFMLARKSVSFDIDDLDEKFAGFVQKWDSDSIVYPYIIERIRQMGTPHGWKLVEEKKHFLSPHPVTKGTDVNHVSFRFERA